MKALKIIALIKLIIESIISILLIALIIMLISFIATFNDTNGGQPPIPIPMMAVIVFVSILTVVNAGIGIAQIVMGARIHDTLSIVSGSLSVAALFVGITIIGSFIIDIMILCAKKPFNFDNTSLPSNRSIDGNPFNPDQPNLGRARVDSPFNNNPNAQPNSKNPFNDHQNQDKK